jgi:anti-sigma regulatory factor (Ser/Thr protein kinase)
MQGVEAAETGGVPSGNGANRDSRVWFLRPVSRSLSEFRAGVGRVLSGRVPEDVNRDVLLALDELITNAIVHGGSRRVIVHMRVNAHRVTATVRDSGPGLDLRRLIESWPPSTDAEGGRGIYLATRLMDAVAIRSRSGTMVHVSRDLGDGRDRENPVCVWRSESLARFSHR